MTDLHPRGLKLSVPDPLVVVGVPNWSLSLCRDDGQPSQGVCNRGRRVRPSLVLSAQKQHSLSSGISLETCLTTS
jgi:hypothetical protein